MEYRFTPKARKDFKRLPPYVQNRIIKKLDYYTSRKYPLKHAASLVDNEIGQYRFRMGDYRIVVDVKRRILYVLRIGHRDSIYK